VEVTGPLTELIILETIAIKLVVTARTIIVPANALSFLVAIPCTSLYKIDSYSYDLHIKQLEIRKL
jgi:hypothetical protein